MRYLNTLLSLIHDTFCAMARRRQHLTSDDSGEQSPISDLGTAFLADALRTARLDRQLSQAALAARLGLRQRQISDLERGNVDARVSTIQNVARALDLELMLIPRPLISAVEALQRASGGGDQRPLYALDEEEETAPEESHVEVGDTGAFGPGAEEPSKRKGPRS
jgi:transcriptional regulator with XRE-family HTH domain